MIFQFRVTL